VPFLIRYPGKIEPGTTSDKLVQLNDITATLLTQANYSEDQIQEWMPETMDLLKLIEQGVEYDHYRDYAICAFRNTGYGPGGTYFDPPLHGTMFLSGNYKLNVFHNFADPDKLEGQLFDMESDPLEENDLWNDPGYQELRFEMTHRLTNWMVRNSDRYSGGRGGEKFRQQVTME